MAKPTTLYVCTNCDAQFPKWEGRCSECGQWGTLAQQGKGSDGNTSTPAQVIDLNDIGKEEGFSRLVTKVEEIDRVFGGGIVAGSLTLLAGEPGIGKSTLVAQIADKLGADNDVLYASGEESLPQIKMRLERLNCNLKKLRFVNDTDIEKIIAAAEKMGPKLVIIDSIQTVHTSTVPQEAGGINQIRAVAVKCLEFAKRRNIAFIVIGHITKDGTVAGPKSLEHLVDTVLYLEQETARGYQLLRASKNRFGSTNELGIFEMTSKGFIAINNPSAVFLETNMENASGSVVSCIIEGTRPFLVEIQALVTKTVFGYPQRKASGIDLNRLQVLAAVINKRTKLNLTAQDIIVNVVGGLRIDDPGIDAAVCAAIISSLVDKPLRKGLMVFGEIGLGGELRPVPQLSLRLKEAAKLGFKNVIGPNEAKNLNELAAKLF